MAPLRCRNNVPTPISISEYYPTIPTASQGDLSQPHIPATQPHVHDIAISDVRCNSSFSGNREPLSSCVACTRRLHVQPRSRGALRVRALRLNTLCNERAQGMPGAGRNPWPACNKESRRQSPQVQPNIRHSLRDSFNAYT
jgi:hypothetical protein